METLTPDAKYALAEKLSGGELVRLCSTDRSLRKICQSSRYNTIWKQKLKEEFNVDYQGANAYMMYLHNIYFYGQTYWLVAGDTIPALFRTRKEALNHMVEVMPYSVPKTLAEIKKYGDVTFEDERITITLESIQFETKKQKDYVKAYDDKLVEIAKMIGDYDQDTIDNFIKNFKITMEDSIESEGSILESIESLLSTYFENYDKDEKIREKIDDVLDHLLFDKYYL